MTQRILLIASSSAAYPFALEWIACEFPDNRLHIVAPRDFPGARPSNTEYSSLAGESFELAGNEMLIEGLRTSAFDLAIILFHDNDHLRYLNVERFALQIGASRVIGLDRCLRRYEIERPIYNRRAALLVDRERSENIRTRFASAVWAVGIALLFALGACRRLMLAFSPSKRR